MFTSLRWIYFQRSLEFSSLSNVAKFGSDWSDLDFTRFRFSCSWQPFISFTTPNVLLHTCAQVREWEIDQIVSSLNGFFPGVQHKLAFVVVTKRISTRFFAHTPNGGFTNPPPGTVVDSEVTRPERYDFFLVSQSVRQGTVSPTHYNIIYDTTGLKPDHMQRLSYKLTHLYFNWPGTIRVPAPCQYAHKLAFLAGQSLHGEHHSRLNTTLFYL